MNSELRLSQSTSFKGGVWKYRSAVEHLPRMCLAIGSIFSGGGKVIQALHAIKSIHHGINIYMKDSAFEVGAIPWLSSIQSNMP